QTAFFAAGHIAVKLGGANPASFAETHFEAMARKRRVEITAASFTMVAPLLAGTDRLAVMHERLARSMAQNFEIDWQPLPFEFPVMREMIQYNRTRSDDVGLRWLIDELSHAIEAPHKSREDLRAGPRKADDADHRLLDSERQG